MGAPLQRTSVIAHSETSHALIVHPDADHLARAAAEWLCSHLEAKVGVSAVALSGGSTPRRLYETLASADYQERLPWDRVHWFWGDERLVPPETPPRGRLTHVMSASLPAQGV